MRNRGWWWTWVRPNWPQESINNRQRGGARWWTLEVYFQLWHHMLVVVIHRKWGQACHHWKWPTCHRIWDQALCHGFKDRHSTYIATMWISRQPTKKLSPKLNNSYIIIHFISFPLKFYCGSMFEVAIGFWYHHLGWYWDEIETTYYWRIWWCNFECHRITTILLKFQF